MTSHPADRRTSHSRPSTAASTAATTAQAPALPHPSPAAASAARPAGSSRRSPAPASSARPIAPPLRSPNATFAALPAALSCSSPLATTTSLPAALALLLAAVLFLLLPAHARAGIAAAPSPLHPAVAAAPSPGPTGVGTGPSVQSSYAGFTDLNGNGTLDCGEPIDLLATFATNNSGTPALAGSLFAPVNGTAGITFLHGSVVIDPDLTNGCSGSIVAGNGPDDSDFRVDFSCPADPIDNNSWTLVVRYRATYNGTASPPSFSAGATANLTNGATYSNVVTVPAGTACGGGGVPTQIALAKTAAGPATPASLLVYTLTATDQSGAGDGGVQLVEVVPAHTTFSTTGSSPGWTCAAPPSSGSGGTPGNAGDAGSTCRNPIGNLTPNGTRATFFAVTLDPLLPAAPVALANTACVYAGPTLATCTSITTPAAGTPTLHLAKALAAGAPAAAVPGATLAYTLTAANTGNQALADATLEETVPANTTFAPALSSGSAGGGPRWSCTPSTGTPGATCTLDLGPLAAQATATTATFAVTVANPLPALPPGALIANTACLQTTSPGTAGAVGVTPSCSTVSTPVNAQPVLHAAKTLRAGTGAPGTTLLYDLAVQNTGNEAAAAVTATETVPANTTFATGGATPGWSCSPASGTAGAACTLAAGPLAAGTTTHLLFAVTVDLPLAAGVTAIANTACFQLPAPILESTSRPARHGATAAPSSAAPPTAAAPNPRAHAAAGRHTAEASSAASPSASSAASDPKASATPGAAGTPTCDTLSTPTLGSPLLAVAKSYTGPPAAAGAILPFQLTVTNTGNQDAVAVTLSETVPAHTTFSPGHSTTGWSCTPPAGTAGATCTLALGPLAGAAAAGSPGAARSSSGAAHSIPFVLPSATAPLAAARRSLRGTAATAATATATAATATFAVQVASPLPAGVQQIANTACAGAPGLAPVCGQATSPPPANNSHLAAELTYTFVRNALRNGHALAGDVLNYTLTVTNPSPTAARSVGILIPLDPHLALDVGSVTTTLGAVTAGNTPGEPGGTTPAVQIATLAPGATCTVQLDATVGPLPPALRLLSTQATLAAANAPPTVSDDPSTPEPLDPTTTPVGTAPPPLVQPIPTLTTWGLLALIVTLAAAACRILRSLRPRPTATGGATPTGAPR
jgi:uncharacterized repeat protein (TIGR01451 family)